MNIHVDCKGEFFALGSQDVKAMSFQHDTPTRRAPYRCRDQRFKHLTHSIWFTCEYRDGIAPFGDQVKTFPLRDRLHVRNGLSDGLWQIHHLPGLILV